MPAEFRRRGDVSMFRLLKESGYDAAELPLSEEAIERHLREHPDLVSVWTAHSEEQRCSPGWYLAQPGTGLDGAEGWRVGYYTVGRRPPERLFANEFSACAFYIARFLESLAGSTAG